ncbi:MAG: PIN domain-containing protein [Dehalococcoidia bacterium]
MTTLDTNIIVRYLTQDEPDQSRRARTVFEEVEAGRRTVNLIEAVLVETEQVLSSKNLYHLPRVVITHHLTRLLRMQGVKIPNKQMYLLAFDFYESHMHLSFFDCLLVAYTERSGNTSILSFDRGFDRQTVQQDTAVKRSVP